MMNIKGTNIYIMWKEIGVMLLVVALIRLSIDIYIVKIYKKICKKFYSKAWNGLDGEIKKHRKLCNVFSVGPWNKNIRLMYNGCCVALASIALIKNDEVEFVNQLNLVKKETDFEMKSFMLALYYCSKQDEITAKKYFDSYLKCNKKNGDIKVIMDYLFVQGKTQQREEFDCAIQKFQNPAILKLFEENKFYISK